MNKAELIDVVALRLDTSKAAAGRAVEAVLGGIEASLATGIEVRLSGFGVFDVKARSARTGRNPQTGKPLAIPAKKSVVFKAWKTLNDTL